MVIVIGIGFLDCNHVAVAVMFVVLDSGVFGAASPFCKQNNVCYSVLNHGKLESADLEV